MHVPCYLHSSHQVYSTCSADFHRKIDYIYDVTKRQEDQTVKVAISSATYADVQFVQRICGAQIAHALPPVFEQSKTYSAAAHVFNKS